MNTNKPETTGIEEIKQMFISGVERVLSSLEEGERFGTKEEFAKRLWGDSNVQYAFNLAVTTERQRGEEMVKAERERMIEDVHELLGELNIDSTIENLRIALTPDNPTDQDANSSKTLNMTNMNGKHLFQSADPDQDKV